MRDGGFVTITVLPKSIQTAINDLEHASENLGSIDGSYGWNAAHDKVEKAEKALTAAILAELNRGKTHV